MEMFEEIVPLLGSFGLGLLGTICGGLLLKKLMFSTEKIEEIVDVILEMATRDEEVQKKLYYVGALLGTGIKGGLGINKARGKFSLEALAAEIFGQVAPGLVNKILGQGQEEERKPLFGMQ